MAANLGRLSIYGYPQCPFCSRVLRAIDALGLDVEFRNTMQGDEYYRELTAATGRSTVPVLRIESEDGAIEWMSESIDIVAYLENLEQA